MTRYPVRPPREHQYKRLHWLMVDRLLWTAWVLAEWDSDGGVWLRGGRKISPQIAGQRRWRYSGPALSPDET